MKYHMFAGGYEDGGMSTYKGLLTIEEANAIVRADTDVWAELVSVQEDGTLVIVAELSTHRDQHQDEDVRVHVGEWAFIDGTALAAFRVREVRKPLGSLTGTTPDGRLVAFGGTLHIPGTSYNATGVMPSHWVEDRGE